PSPATTAATGGTPTTTAADAPVAIDVLVGPGALDSSPATTLASRFGCPSRVAGSGTAPTATVSNFCDPALNARITAALDGSLPFTAAARSLEPKLWSQAVILPLFQLRDLVAVRHDMHGVSGSPPLVTPFAGAALWRRSAR
ncbi:MAG: ABC transporter family substrate-binding protein, partial [Sciscionella sp.]